MKSDFVQLRFDRISAIHHRKFVPAFVRAFFDVGRQQMLVYLIVLSTTFSGMMHAPVWAAVAGACVLSLLLIAEKRDLSTSPTGSNFVDGPIAIAAALFNGSAAASAAFVLGRGTAWIWGI